MEGERGEGREESEDDEAEGKKVRMMRRKGRDHSEMCGESLLNCVWYLSLAQDLLADLPKPLQPRPWAPHPLVAVPLAGGMHWWRRSWWSIRT
jgi:hypothetical protein